jgi:hypothetical protein
MRIYILSVVSRECEPRSVTLRKLDKLWVLEKRVLRQTFKLKWEGIKRRWRKKYK